MSDLQRYQPQQPKLKHPEWSKNAGIYQINTRQFTPEGTFRAAESHLPRLQALGVDILWLMPIHKIGVKNRKGTLGSPYSVQDYYSINPEFGDLDDLKQFVTEAHKLGMYVIIDWVINHSAWDCNLVTEHPEWYARDWKGAFHPTPWWDWSDIIDFDYSHPELRQYLTDVMKYWVAEADIDGFRCDTAGFIPTEFWNNARQELESIKPVFMLAEWEARDLHQAAFDATYAWSWNKSLHDIAMNGGNIGGLFVYYSWNEKSFPRDAYRMTFVSNHDHNAWDGTQFERFGDGLEAAIVLSVVGEGLPLIYNGQEAGNPKRLAFFEKDQIEWREHPIGDLYKRLLALKKKTRALWNGAWGARMVHVVNNVPDKIFSFVRQNEDEKVFAVFNFSGEAQAVEFIDGLHCGAYVDFETGENVVLEESLVLKMPAWSYKIFIKPK